MSIASDRDKKVAVAAIAITLLLVSIFASEYLVPVTGQTPLTMTFAACCITLLALTMTWGVADQPTATSARVLIAIGHGLLLVVVGLVAASNGKTQPRVLGMLPATAAFMLGIWSVSALFIGGWLRIFDRAVFGKQDQNRLDHARTTVEDANVDSTQG